MAASAIPLLEVVLRGRYPPPIIAMRFSLRTLLIILAVAPPIIGLAWVGGRNGDLMLLLQFLVAVPFLAFDLVTELAVETFVASLALAALVVLARTGQNQ